MNALEQAVIAAAEHGAPAREWQVGEDATVTFENRHHPFDHMQVTAWELPDVMTGRSE
jgi:hypothetical protein